MNLNDIIQAAQGGQGVANLGAQFGLTPEQTQAAVQALMPAFSTALQKVTSDPSGLAGIVSHLASGVHRFVHRRRPRRRGDERRRRAEPDLRLVADRFADRRPRVERERRRRADDPQMMPAVASMLLGGLAHALTAQGRRRARAIDERRRGDGRPGRGGSGRRARRMVTSLVGNLFGGGQSGRPRRASPRRA